MANSKNTIQNIPLASELCMNALKTEVKQFQGYNEKNTTLYGGTLSPMWDNKKELPFDKDKSYTFFNSKGQDFTLLKEGTRIITYKGTERYQDAYGDLVSWNERLDVPLNTFMATKCPDDGVLWLTDDGTLYKDGKRIEKVTIDFSMPGYERQELVDCQVHFQSDTQTLLAITYNGYSGNDETYTNFTRLYLLEEGESLIRFPFTWSLIRNAHPGKAPFVSFRKYGDDEVYLSYRGYGGFYSFAGNPKTVLEAGFQSFLLNVTEHTISEVPSSSSPSIYVESLVSPGQAHSTFSNSGSGFYYIELERFASRIISNSKRYAYGQGSEGVAATKTFDYVPLVDSDERLSCPLGFYSDQFYYNRSGGNPFKPSIYYKDGNLISIGCCGLPIAQPLSFTSNIVTPYRSDSNYFMISYKSGNDWYCYKTCNVSFTEDLKYIQKMVWDDRYVLLQSINYGLRIYDTETGSFMKEKHLDWILSDPLLSNTETGGTSTGVVYAAGVNAAYTLTNKPFVGYLANPYLGQVFNPPPSPANFVMSYTFPWTPSDAQVYYSIGDTTQSATYKGANPEYQDTVYPIDQNGNVVLPISMNTQIIKGYSNNDLVKEESTVYPLMYWNNNQKVYAYYLLSGIENITNVFSLQGQQYAVDDENIYAIAFNGGVVSQVQSVSYKKNLTFQGTLPTQAVFWSDFNKTFYAFTGDRILSKMFEASDIHKILYVRQNPSSLSLWVCTDTGIYVLSDTDQFKLDYVSEQIAFQPQSAFIITTDEENTAVHKVSLYLKDGEKGEMIPVKLQTSYYGLGNEMKAVMDCWYLRLFDENNTKGYVKAKVHTITDVTRHTEEKTFEVNPSDYDENHIVYLRFQPKYQECVSMQLELETNLGIYQISLGVNTTDSTAQVSKFNF